MGTCRSTGAVEENYLYIPMSTGVQGKAGGAVTDLETLFKSWAWENYLRSAKGKKLKFREAQIQLVWDHVKCKSDKPVYTQLETPIPGTSAGVPSTETQVVFTSRYQNDTAVAQTHAFRAEKTTNATITTTITKGFAKEGSFGLELSLPADVAKATIGFGLNYTVETAEEHTIAKSMTWATDTTVTSEPKSVTLAELEIEEQASSWTFEVKVTIKGRITAVIKGTKGMTSVAMTIDGDVATILEDRRAGTASSVPKDVEIKHGKVTWPVTGKCDFRFGVSQKVKVSPAQPIDKK
ncbi:uncharacterized protein LOC124289665 isoform X2 [Haliotis rubra]|uniref:uncharacterized protein LOC124289665 isoform X2 n=1 Tax=Haliotis rubra TaxID=36100 RepID=UPI001EE5B389|nr:uncharacterized protein LOC124289665 isoform X2 [Haliotis rubra]XP_046582228.1 uncharacterized protein LOC124289665 isoform X2 [Haliotis rubra]